MQWSNVIFLTMSWFWVHGLLWCLKCSPNVQNEVGFCVLQDVLIFFPVCAEFQLVQYLLSFSYRIHKDFLEVFKVVHQVSANKCVLFQLLQHLCNMIPEPQDQHQNVLDPDQAMLHFLQVLRRGN